uniref:Uncharacterized protein n=1 Tax=Nelumbo nucifera TaxID=4432 RepID=A0A822ZFM7_NELNU|nr:TPA_asm: hypothetical protein HUJ06_001603 [Nelumbo nucifera]
MGDGERKKIKLGMSTDPFPSSPMEIKFSHPHRDFIPCPF